MESMCITFQDRNNNCGQNYYDSNYLNHVTFQLFTSVEYKIQFKSNLNRSHFHCVYPITQQRARRNIEQEEYYGYGSE
jgi:hypothetical protein